MGPPQAAPVADVMVPAGRAQPRAEASRPGTGAGVADLPARRSWRERFAAAEWRVRDVTICAGLLIATLPVSLAAVCLIKLDSPGPVFYHQVRAGLHGQPFTLLKFRTMRPDAESGGPSWAAVRDPRITRIGAHLRAARIDELPQLLNVLRGDMSLIGPRPERPHFVAQLVEVIPGYHQRTEILPGITGWAQVNRPYGASVEDARDKLRYDLYYVRHRSRLLDLRILMATIRVVLLGIGAR